MSGQSAAERRFPLAPRVAAQATLYAAMMAALACAASPAAAQQIQGRVLSASDSAPASAALVQLLDGGGTRLAQSTTAPGGTFLLRAPAPGRYVVAVYRIGQHPWRSGAFDLDSGVVRRVTLAVPDEPITLDSVSVEARSACRRSPAEGGLIAALLGEADRALTVTRLEMERGDEAYDVERYQRTQTVHFRTVDSTGPVAGFTAWPIRSAPPESLAVHGFVREDSGAYHGPYEGGVYFGLDAELLLSGWFLSTHCFGVAEGSGADSGTIVVTFRPEGGARADVAGRLVLAREPLELRRIEWRYVRLPLWVNRSGAGGSMTLMRLPSGAFLPSSWWMRGPVAELSRRGESRRLWGWREIGGRVVPTP